MTHPAIEKMALDAVCNAAKRLRDRGHLLSTAYTGDNARACNRAAQAMWRAAAVLEEEAHFMREAPTAQTGDGDATTKV